MGRKVLPPVLQYLTLLHTPQENLEEWWALSENLDAVLPLASADLSRTLLLNLLQNLQLALGSRVHRIEWLHDLLFSIAQVRILLKFNI